MIRITTAAIAAAALIGASSLAMAQTQTPQSTTPMPPDSRGSANSPNTTTGAVSGTSKMRITTEAEARTRLEADGYTNIQDLKPDHDGWRGMATKNGKQVSVDVDKDGSVDVKK